MLIAVRHGRTDYNEDGHEKLRGRLNIPLSKDGMEEAIKAGEVVNNLRLPLNSFISSPLKRARQTAETVGNEINQDPEFNDKLTDWNVGSLTGKGVKETLPVIHNYLDNPNKKIPDGESYNDFRNRTEPLLKQLIESSDNHLIVSHNRVMTLLNAIVKNKGNEPDMNTLKKKGPIEPGGVMMISPDYELQVIHQGVERTAPTV